MNLNDLLVFGIVANSPTEKTIIEKMLKAGRTPDQILEQLTVYREDLEYSREQAAKRDAAKRAESDKFIRPATKRDTVKNRNVVQTRFRRATLGGLDEAAKADKKSNCFERQGVRAKASKEKKYNRGSDPAGFSNKSQGAGNVVGAKGKTEIIDTPRYLGGMYI